MKRIPILGLILLSLLLSVKISAHPASEVTLSYNAETMILKVGFSHKVRIADDHFIYKITVRLNGKDMISQEVGRQSSPEGGELIYKIIDAAPGDRIKVVTRCNKGGNKSAEIVIPE